MKNRTRCGRRRRFPRPRDGRLEPRFACFSAGASGLMWTLRRSEVVNAQLWLPRTTEAPMRTSRWNSSGRRAARPLRVRAGNALPEAVLSRRSMKPLRWRRKVGRPRMMAKYVDVLLAQATARRGQSGSDLARRRPGGAAGERGGAAESWSGRGFRQGVPVGSGINPRFAALHLPHGLVTSRGLLRRRTRWTGSGPTEGIRRSGRWV